MTRTSQAFNFCGVALLAAALLVGPAAGQALDQLMGANDQPVTIDAQDGIEWRQDEQVYIARGKARASRGKVSITADLLRAHYRKGKDGNNEIWKVDAIGAVYIDSGKESVYGDKGIYNLDTGVFTLTGDDLRIKSGDGQSVTARDKLEYRHKERVARALGNATATKDDKILRADVLTAFFTEDANGKQTIKRVEATGGVIVTTEVERATAIRAQYDAKREMVTLSGDVKLTRGSNQLNGEYAEVNLKTGVSRLLARPRGASGGQPVRGLFVPGSEDKKGLGLSAPGVLPSPATKKSN